jgi:hypothetical protein
VLCTRVHTRIQLALRADMRKKVLYVPGAFLGVVIWIAGVFELVEPMRAVNPIFSLLLGSPFVYTFCKTFTEKARERMHTHALSSHPHALDTVSRHRPLHRTGAMPRLPNFAQDLFWRCTGVRFSSLRMQLPYHHFHSRTHA